MTELIKAENLAVSQYATDEVLSDIAKSSSFLPYVQLFAVNATAVAEGKIGGGHFGLPSGDDIVDLGKEFNCIPLSWRPKAMSFGDEVISIYNPNNPEFNRIRAAADADSNSGNVYGPEFLLWIAGHGFATYLLGSKSSRREATNLKGLFGKAATLRTKLVKNVKGSWFVPVSSVCSEPFEGPSEDEVLAELDKFNNATDSTTQTLTEEEQAESGRAR